MDINLKNIVNTYIEAEQEKLGILSNLVKNYKKGFDYKKINIKKDLRLPLDIANLKQVIYYFEIENIDNDFAHLICESIEHQKARKNNIYKLPKVNIKNIQDNNKILYVGKSFGRFEKRLSQHLGLASKKVYALHLNQWSEWIKKDITLKLYYFSFEENNITDETLEMFESAMHYQFKPILGRSGH